MAIIKLADNIISPLGIGTKENYEAVKAGRSALRAYPATELLPEGYFASLIDDAALAPLYASLGLDGPAAGQGQTSATATHGPSQKTASAPALQQTCSVFEKRCIACAAPAIRDAGIDPSSPRVLFLISTTKANVELLDGGAEASSPERRSPAAAALQISRYFGNPNTPLVVSNACISGLAAQIEAMRALDAGEFDYAVVIGADVVGRFVISGFQSLKALSPEQCRPFDAARCGLNLGEAAACIVYGAAGAIAPAPTAASVAAAAEPSLNQGQIRDGAAENAFPSLNQGQNRDGAAENAFPSLNRGQNRDGGSRRLWVAAAGAICNDANHISGPSRTGEGSYRALVQTLGLDYQPWPAAPSAAPATSATPAAPASESAAVVADIAFVNVHGTSTLYNDEMESFAITRAGLQNTPVNTLKGYFGHTLGAAGVLETILSMAAVEDGTILGTRGFESIGVSNPLRLTAEHSAIKGGKRSFVKLLSGFGGCNAAMLFRLSDASAVCDSVRSSADNQPVKKNARLKKLHSVEISPSAVLLDGAPLQVEGTGPTLLENLYRSHVGDWPKFFKMDPLARLGFLASELLLRSAAPCPVTPIAKPAPAVILFNRSGSLADDINYQAGIDGPDHLGSPSLFVYTLPNIVTGEIAIRNKFLSETSFYCIPEPDEQLMQSIVARALEPGQRAICGWCECSSEDDFYAKMCILAS